MGALTACHLLKLKRKKVKFAPGETPAFVFCAKNFRRSFENFFLFMCIIYLELIMKLNRNKLRVLIREAVLKEFLDSGGSGPERFNVGFILRYLADQHRKMSRKDVWTDLLYHDKNFNLRPDHLKVYPDYEVDYGTFKSTKMIPMVLDPIRQYLDADTQEELEATDREYSAAIQKGLIELDKKYPMALKNIADEIQRLRDEGLL